MHPLKRNLEHFADGLDTEVSRVRVPTFLTPSFYLAHPGFLSTFEIWRGVEKFQKAPKVPKNPIFDLLKTSKKKGAKLAEIRLGLLSRLMRVLQKNPIYRVLTQKKPTRPISVVGVINENEYVQAVNIPCQRRDFFEAKKPQMRKEGNKIPFVVPFIFRLLIVITDQLSEATPSERSV